MDASITTNAPSALAQPHPPLVIGVCRADEFTYKLLLCPDRHALIHHGMISTDARHRARRRE